MITPTILNISSSAISSISNTAKRIDPIGKTICETAKRALKNVDKKTKQLLNGSDQAEQFRIQIPSIDFNVPEFALNLPIIPDDQDEFNINLVEQLPLPLNINGNNNELLLDLAPQIPPQYYLNLLNPNQQANNQLEIDPPYNPYNDLPPPNNPAGGIILIDLPPQEFNALPLEALQPIKVKRCAR